MSDLIKRLRGWSKSNGAPIWEEAAALIVSQADALKRKDAEIAGLRQHAECMADDLEHANAEGGWQYMTVRNYRAARPKE